MAGMNFKKKSVICQKIEKLEKGLKQLSDPPERIVVEIVGGSDRPKKPPVHHFFPKHVAFVSEITKDYREVVNYLLKKWLH